MVYLLAISGSTIINHSPSQFHQALLRNKELLRKKVSVVAICMPDEIVRRMIDGAMFVNSLHSILTRSVNPKTGVNTQRLFQLKWLMFSNLHSEVRPSCLQTTLASLKSQLSLHTVPHCPWKHTSTRPSKLFLPPTSRISVSLQAADKVRQTAVETKKHHCIRQ